MQTRIEQARVRVGEELEALTGDHAEAGEERRRAVESSHVSHKAVEAMLEQSGAKRQVIGLNSQRQTAHKEHICEGVSGGVVAIAEHEVVSVSEI